MRLTTAFALQAVVVCASCQVALAEPLRTLIDQHLPAPEFGRCSDAEFMRRVSLDLAGMPPTVDELRAFLADSTSDKRERLVDRLLASPHYARQLATTLDLMLMERRANQQVGQDEWQAWLLQAVRENKPWNLLAREILAADGSDPAHRAPARFYLDRGAEPNLLTRDIGRVLFGRDMQCAQCHNHPLVDDYRQSDYHGLLAFFTPGYALELKDGDKKLTVYAEKAGTDERYESVFFRGKPHLTGPRVLGGSELDEPFFYPGEEYQTAPADNVKPVPKFSRRALLAELATNGSNRAFNENIANRLWAHMLGRGLVNPVDMMHPDNPAADPALLRELGERFAQSGFDIRGFLREIALTQVYQRAVDLPANLLSLSAQAAAGQQEAEAQLEALEEAARSSSETYKQSVKEWNLAENAVLPVQNELDEALKKYSEMRKKLDEAAKALADAQAQLKGRQDIASSLQAAATAAQQAAAKLPEDKELAAAAQKFADRSQQLAGELDGLKKSVDEKAAAHQAQMAALDEVKQPVDAALAKLEPLREAMRQQEQAVVAARQQKQLDGQRLASFSRDLETRQKLAQLTDLHQAITDATQALQAREAELVTARQQANDYAKVVTQQEAQVQAASDALAAATNARKVIESEFAERSNNAQAVQAAFETTDAARLKLPDDPTLQDAAAKLGERARQLQALVAEAQKRLDDAETQGKLAASNLETVRQAMTDVQAEQQRRAQAVAAADAAVNAARDQVAEKQSASEEAVSELSERWTKDFTLATLKPLTPEQMCWSIFRVTGVYKAYWQAEVAELDKTNPLSDEQKQDPVQMEQRVREIEQKTFDKLKGNVGTFVQFYGAGAGQPQGDFFATADQALFAANAGAINSWVAPSGGNVTERVMNQSDPRGAAEELYLGVLSRMPTDQEVEEVTKYLASRTSDRNVAAQELVWGLINSVEFRFNH